MSFKGFLDSSARFAIFSNPMAQMIGNATFMFWYVMVYSYWTAWEYQALSDVPEYGELTYLGSSQETYGPTTLTVFKYRFEGVLTAPDMYLYSAEIWLAPTQFGGIATYIHQESIKEEGVWVTLELKHIELVEPQEVPPEPEPEEEPEKPRGIPRSLMNPY